MRNFLAALALLIFTVTAAVAQTTTTQSIDRLSPQSIAQDALRSSIPSGDFIAQTLFAVLPPPIGFEKIAPLAADAKTENISVLPTLIGYFNMLIMALGLIAFAWRGTEYIVDLGREGKTEAGGMTAWGPIRAILGMFMIVPIPGAGGWNSIQYVTSTLALGGYQVGNMMWVATVKASGATSRLPVVPPLSPELPEYVATVGQMDLCRVIGNMAAFEHWGTEEAKTFMRWDAKETDKSMQFRLVMNPATGGVMPWITASIGNWINLCGQVTIHKTASNVSGGMMSYNTGKDSIAARAHIEATTELIKRAQLTNGQLFGNYMNGDPDWKIKAVAAYDSYMTAGVREYATKLSTTAAKILSEGAQRTNNSAESQFEQTANYAGWTNAGNFIVTYFRVATSASNVASKLPSYSAPVFESVRRLVIDRFSVKHYDLPNGFGEVVESYRRVASRYVDPQAPDWAEAGTGGQSGFGAATANSSNVSSNLATAGASRVAEVTGMFAVNTVQDLMRMILDPTVGITGGWNPNVLQSQIDIGHYFMMIGGTMTATMLAGDMAAKAFTAVPGPHTVLGGDKIAKMVNGVAFAGALVGTFLLGVGILFAYILPILFALCWYMAVLQWVMVVIEGIVVGALFGLANVRFEGQGMVSDQGKHGMAVFFNITVRPLIMSIGIPIMVLVYSMMSTAISNGLWKYTLPGMIGDSFYGPIAFASIFAMISVVQVAMLVWIADFPNRIANNIVQWLGLHPGPDYQTTQGVNSATQIAAGAGVSQVSSMVKRTQETANALKKANSDGKSVRDASDKPIGRAGTGGGVDK